MQTEIFIGPTYYFRLKHMVAEKINARGLGPKVQLTRQPTGGRRKAGGLRIGEMERDSLISHGISKFIKEILNTNHSSLVLEPASGTGDLAILLNNECNIHIDFVDISEEVCKLLKINLNLNGFKEENYTITIKDSLKYDKIDKYYDSVSAIFSKENVENL